MFDMAAIILAAGKGTRMKSKLPKAIHELCGKPMTRYIIDACKKSGIEKCIIVAGYGAELVKEKLGDDVVYVIQHEQCGTGDACRQAIPSLIDYDGDVFVTIGDAPLLSSAIINDLIREHISSGNDATLLTTILNDAAHYGRIVRDDQGNIEGIVEAKDATKEQIEIREINTAIYCFKMPLLRKYIAKLSNENAQGEYYLTDVIGFMYQDGYKLGSVVTDDSDAVLGINDRQELFNQTDKIRTMINKKHMSNGVTFIDPTATYISGDTEIGMDTVIYPQTHIEGKCKIGEGCVIGPSTRLSNMTIGDNTSVMYSNLTESIVGNDVKIGPFAHLRPGCIIGNNVKIGNFVEGKNADIADRVSMGHLTYIGDASVGEHTNIGAGTITCNYDGFRKHRTVIGKEAFIGSHTTLIAPVEVGDGALTAAGTVVTSTVPSDSMCIGRPELQIKPDYAKIRREKMEKDIKKTNG